MSLYGIRAGTASDVPFLMRRTLKDLRNMDFTRYVDKEMYFTYMHRAFEHVFTDNIVRVAYPAPQPVASGVKSGDTRRIVGYLVCKPTRIGLVIHYCNTRRSVDDSGMEVENYRRQGIARQLVESVIKDYEIDPGRPITYTIRTAQFRYSQSWRDYVDQGTRFRYNPFLFFTLLPAGWEAGIKHKPSHEEADFTYVQ